MKRIVVVDKELCKFEKCKYKCAKVCPLNRSGKECIKPDPEKGFPVFDEDLCIGCGICVKACENLNFNAISLVNLPKELDQPVHRYGKNGFAIYRLPIPKEKMVVGLIGANGIGKTTVLNILSGKIKPNAGIPYGGWDIIMEKFKGTELQNYIEKLKKSEIKIGYKPQNIDAIPNLWKGSVKEFFENFCDEIKDSVIDNLSIRNVLDKDVNELSGGELQLVAIAAVLMKRCDLYFFDEPSSYLDVKQRFLVSKEIRNLAKNNVVMVVEHDLAILDYLSDQIHIFYGKRGVFGVVSKPYSVRNGINTYLEGYIKEENVRFRENSIFFSKRAKISEKNKVFLNFSGFEKSFKGFKLETEPGDLYKGEVIGILGPNAAGKTTFIRMLVGELNPDKGFCIKGYKISYKPQRLVLNNEECFMTVGEFLSGCKKTELFPENLMEKQMGSLSGGELQCVFITKALGSEHDILFLDEPSAFLDVEQRLLMAKIIRNHVESKEISAFVVDHDLQVIDTISDRIMVFERNVSNGFGHRPCSLHDGMNMFLKNLDITFRRDPHTGRARVNKPYSQKDMEQKKIGEYYYMG